MLKLVVVVSGGITGELEGGRTRPPKFSRRSTFQFVQIRGEKLGEGVTLLSEVLICSL